MAPPGPVKIGHKKDGRQRWPHRFHVSRPPLTRPLDPLLGSLKAKSTYIFHTIWLLIHIRPANQNLNIVLQLEIFCF